MQTMLYTQNKTHTVYCAPRRDVAAQRTTTTQQAGRARGRYVADNSLIPRGTDIILNCIISNII